MHHPRGGFPGIGDTDGSAARPASRTSPGASRASLGIYNVAADVERFLSAMRVVSKRAWAGEYTWNDGVWQSPPVSEAPAQVKKTV